MAGSILDDLLKPDEEEAARKAVERKYHGEQVRPYGHAKPGPKAVKHKYEKLRKGEDGKYLLPTKYSGGSRTSLSKEDQQKLIAQTVEEMVNKVKKEHRKLARQHEKDFNNKEKRYREATAKRAAEIDKQIERAKELEESKYSLLAKPTNDNPNEALEKLTKKRFAKKIKWTPKLMEEYKAYQKHEAEKRKKIDADILTAGESLMPVTSKNESEKNKLNLAGFKRQKNLHEKYLEAKQENEINTVKLRRLWNTQNQHTHQYEVKFFMANQITAACKVCSKELNMSIFDWIKFQREKGATGEP